LLSHRKRVWRRTRPRRPGEVVFLDGDIERLCCCALRVEARWCLHRRRSPCSRQIHSYRRRRPDRISTVSVVIEQYRQGCALWCGGITAGEVRNAAPPAINFAGGERCVGRQGSVSTTVWAGSVFPDVSHFYGVGEGLPHRDRHRQRLRSYGERDGFGARRPMPVTTATPRNAANVRGSHALFSRRPSSSPSRNPFHPLFSGSSPALHELHRSHNYKYPTMLRFFYKFFSSAPAFSIRTSNKRIVQYFKDHIPKSAGNLRGMPRIPHGRPPC